MSARVARTYARGAAGSAYAGFKRALSARNVTLALAEARDLPKITLADSLALLVLIAEKRADLYDRAAVRYVGAERKARALRRAWTVANR